jgi:hypothetical protein
MRDTDDPLTARGRLTAARAREENLILWFSSIACSLRARTRSRVSLTGVTAPRPAIGQLLLRCLDSGIGQPLHALPQLGHRATAPEGLKNSQPLRVHA